MYKVKLIYIIIVLPIFVFGQNELEITLTEEETKEDFQLLKNSILNYHPDIYLYTPKSKLDSIFSGIENSLSDMPLMEFYKMLFPAISNIRNKHTNLLLPNEVKQYFGNRAKRVPFSFLYRNDSLYVLQDASKEYLVKEGSIITKINGVESKDLVEQMIIFQSSDGFNRTLPLWDISRNFTKNYAVVYGTPNSFDIEYISQNNSTNKVKIKAIRKSEFSKNRKTMSKKNDYEFTVLNDKAILTIATFDISDLKSYNKFLKNTFNKINKLQINKLIVDVRGNLGGRPEASDELLSFLIEKEIHPIKRQYALVDQLPEKEYFLKNEVFKYFHKENFKNNNDTIIVKNASFHKIKPQKDRYSGKIVFLIDENCVSTTSSMLGQVKTHLNAKFVGTETGGNPVTVVANFTVTQILPNSKLEFKLPLIKSEKNVTFANNGRGIIPTVKIEPGVNDLLNNNDLVLKKGIELLENNCTKQSIEY